MVSSSSAWQESYYKESKAELTGGTGEDVKGVLMQTMLGKERFGINITGSAYEKTDARVTITEEMIDALRPVFNEALLFE